VSGDRHGRSECEECSVCGRGVGAVGAVGSLLLRAHPERPERAVQLAGCRTVAENVFALQRRPFESVRRRGRR